MSVITAPRMRLTPLDPGFPVIEFEFPPTEFTETFSASWASEPALTRTHPILQFSHGEQNSFSFEAIMFAKHSGESVEGRLQALKSAVVRDEKLKRPPRFQFTWGSAVDETVVVATIGNIRYPDLRPDGSLRSALFAITLLVYRFIDVELTGKPLPSTFYTTSKVGDQWEDIAQREYGDASLGDLLRRNHPRLPFPGMEAGEIVKLPPRDTLLALGTLEPDSPPLRRTAESLAARRNLFEKRAIPRPSIILR